MAFNISSLLPHFYLESHHLSFSKAEKSGGFSLVVDLDLLDFEIAEFLRNSVFFTHVYICYIDVSSFIS
jgi:hypothetical protein